MVKYWTKALINSIVIEKVESKYERVIDFTPIQEYCVNEEVLWCEGEINTKMNKFQVLKLTKIFYDMGFEAIILQAYHKQQPLYVEIDKEDARIIKVKI